MTSRLHIVCLDVPWPPDYGGAMDMFFKIKALSGLGIRIVLHCFEYGRGESPELEKYCEAIYYYSRKKTFPVWLPYIVSSRKNDLLVRRLLTDDDPVLLEGLHCTYYLYHGNLKRKNVWVRLHNTESEYYRNLASGTDSFYRKFYYLWESVLLRRYEKKISGSTKAFALSRTDQEKFLKSGGRRCEYLPLFMDDIQVTGSPGRGDYCLYHGNLKVPENEEAVEFLIRDVFSSLDIPFVVAGKNPSSRLRKLCTKAGVSLVPDPDDEAIAKLLKDAHIHVLPALNTTGVKMKLLHALVKGRFVLTNSRGAEDAGVSLLCEVADNASGYRASIQKLWSEDFAEAAKEKRQSLLSDLYDPVSNARLIIQYIPEIN